MDVGADGHQMTIGWVSNDHRTALERALYGCCVAERWDGGAPREATAPRSSSAWNRDAKMQLRRSEHPPRLSTAPLSCTTKQPTGVDLSGASTAAAHRARF